MSYTPKQSPLWWTRNVNTTVYFLRELTGVFIALYVMYFLAASLADIRGGFFNTLVFQIISWAGLIAAVFHTITWLWVTVKISPIPLPKAAQIAGFVVLIAAWVGISYALFIFVYAR